MKCTSPSAPCADSGSRTRQPSSDSCGAPDALHGTCKGVWVWVWVCAGQQAAGGPGPGRKLPAGWPLSGRTSGCGQRKPASGSLLPGSPQKHSCFIGLMTFAIAGRTSGWVSMPANAASISYEVALPSCARRAAGRRGSGCCVGPPGRVALTGPRRLHAHCGQHRATPAVDAAGGTLTCLQTRTPVTCRMDHATQLACTVPAVVGSGTACAEASSLREACWLQERCIRQLRF